MSAKGGKIQTVKAVSHGYRKTDKIQPKADSKNPPMVTLPTAKFGKEK